MKFMRKFIAVGVLSSFGGLGVIGLSTTSASALTTAGPGQTSVCNSITASLNLHLALINATAVESAASSTLATAKSDLTTAITNWTNATFDYIHAIDINDPNANVLAQAYANALAKLNTALTAWSNAVKNESQAMNSLVTAQAVDEILTSLQTKFCAP